MNKVVSILLVEDDTLDVLDIRRTLDKMNILHRMHVARNGEEALVFLGKCDSPQQSRPPDLILLDLNLPGKSGLEILSDLKRSPAFCTIPVVMFTTSATESDRTHALERGAQAYITKPSSFDFLVNAVRTACSLGKSSASATC